MGLCVNKATYHLRVQLGLWIPKVHKHQKWSFHMDPMNRHLIKQTKEGIYLVHSQGMSERLYSRTYSIIFFTPPQCLLPVSINKKLEEYYEITGMLAGPGGLIIMLEMKLTCLMWLLTREKQFISRKHGRKFLSQAVGDYVFLRICSVSQKA